MPGSGPGPARQRSVAAARRRNVKVEAVHAALPVGGGNPRTAFGKAAKVFFDPVLVPLVNYNWALASAALTVVPICIFYAIGHALDASVLPVGTPGVALKPLYDAFRNGPFGEWSAHALYPSIISTVYTWGLCWLFAAIDLTLPKWAKDMRVQQGREAGEFPPLGLWHAVRNQASLYSYLVPVFVYQYVTGGPSLYGPPWVEQCFENCNEIPEDPPALLEFSVHFLLSFFMFDCAYWYWHWMHHHHRKLWVKVHRHHHEYNAPFSFVSQYLHPLEFMATGLFAMLAPVALKAHPLTIWCVTIWGVWLSVDAHSGYDHIFGMQHFPFNLFGGGPHHDEHHRRPNSNFQPFFGWAERLCGTDFEAGSADAGAVSMTSFQQSRPRPKGPQIGTPGAFPPRNPDAGKYPQETFYDPSMPAMRWRQEDTDDQYPPDVEPGSYTSTMAWDDEPAPKPSRPAPPPAVCSPPRGEHPADADCGDYSPSMRW